MKANELRIGNYVNFCGRDEEKRISTVVELKENNYIAIVLDNGIYR